MDRTRKDERNEWDGKAADLPVNEDDEVVSPEREASKAVSDAFDKHKAQLDKELKKLGK